MKHLIHSMHVEVHTVKILQYKKLKTYLIHAA